MIRAFLIVSIGWVTGLALAVVLGLLVAVFVPGPAATIAGPIVVGLVVGGAQRWALGAPRPAWSFVALSAVGALAGWLLGSLVAFRLFAYGAGSFASWANGPVLGIVLGILQAPTLKGSAKRKLAWVAASTITWGVAIGALLTAGAPMWLRVASLAAPGILAALASRPRSGADTRASSTSRGHTHLADNPSSLLVESSS